LRALTEKDLSKGIEIELQADIESSIKLLEKKLDIKTYREKSSNSLNDLISDVGNKNEENAEGQKYNKIIDSVKKRPKFNVNSSTKLIELVNFFNANFPDIEDTITIFTDDNSTSNNRHIQEFTSKDLSKGIEVEIRADHFETMEEFEEKLDITTLLTSKENNGHLDFSKSQDEDLSPQEWYDFSNKLREKNILPELTFIFDDVLSNFDTDNHYPFFYTEDVLIANQFTSFIYANIDGVYTSINGDDLSLIMTWDKIKIDEDMGDGIYYVDEDDSPEPEHLTLGTEDEQFLSLSKDKTLYFLEYMWNDIIKDITNLSRDGVVVWNEMKKKLGVERKQFNAWDEIREFINS
jgi:hypothetical protein